jgi:hypothetical protein
LEFMTRICIQRVVTVKSRKYVQIKEKILTYVVGWRKFRILFLNYQSYWKEIT